MNKKIVFGTIAITGLTLILCKAMHKPEEVIQKLSRDYVPDETTAIRIAEAIWLPIYGNKIYDNKPFHAKLKNDSIWVVQGTLHEELGGVPIAEIQKKDCRVLRVIHTK